MAYKLEQQQYSPSRYSCFVVKDPKVREIFAPAFCDRLVHHVLVDRIQPYIDRRFIHDSFANRKGKGTHKAVQRLQKFICNPNNRYFIQMDIQSFFPSIDKNILWRIVRQQVRTIHDISEEECHFILYLTRTILKQNPCIPYPVLTGNSDMIKQIPPHKSMFHIAKGKGLPIGSLTSQFFANLYLNELDQFVKHQLKVKYYIRYVDDIVLLHHNPQQLNQWKAEIEAFLGTQLALKLHPKKTLLQAVSRGINFLGYITYKDHILVRQRTVRALKRRLYFFNHLLNPDKFPYGNPPSNLKITKRYRSGDLLPPVTPTPALLQEMQATINSYYGIFRFADSYKLRKHIYHHHLQELKRYFLPADANYNSIKIKSGVYYWLAAF
ncbi:reverse transcriptase/maturase family protein [Candidatus Venteria ishoeyi]|uniref:reverse transcriptase/maturase family protein n=1 Tax=Candidatus Venteria ishoeyi TaxID=1899563 RepID=UPI00255CD5B4|nr:reverse transcriptase/maturase family protein [Candidatus Venteria ishoeyi]